MHFSIPTLFLLLGTAASAVNAYKVHIWTSTNCTGDVADTINHPSNGKCSAIEGAYSFMYESDIGCTISSYSDAGCYANKASFVHLDRCFTPDYKIYGFVCN
ncbi:MAG: hypothetical protein Q9195_004092 [Heterodermia aff. obscurata]